jgi:hypothetical protein
MKKRILQSLAFLAGVFLSPIWAIIWIINGKNYMDKLFDYVRG